ncbi:hypothetical protein EYF80_018251 [Liparis tanakae]|uniref:Uncharacterized protein n=1 Tax=Liparis tanakae TaxID=230148 RepID=A0A4Z2I268_9TELE|nr:hypothetical protein EYF80_018251 [Liparis tanakae]
MITPLGTCFILYTTPYAPRPSSSFCSKSSAFTTKFWTVGIRQEISGLLCALVEVEDVTHHHFS